MTPGVHSVTERRGKKKEKPFFAPPQKPAKK